MELDTTTKTNEVFEAIKAGTVVAPTSAEELELMLAELGYDASNINFK